MRNILLDVVDIVFWAKPWTAFTVGYCLVIGWLIAYRIFDLNSWASWILSVVFLAVAVFVWFLVFSVLWGIESSQDEDSDLDLADDAYLH